MKELLILSGKGGTGKTTIASAFIALLGAKAYADCDVDAPNLHLVYGGDKTRTESSYYAMPSAVVDGQKCVGCGTCETHCAFHAISLKDGIAEVDYHSCEGCKVCEYVCPVDAISMEFFEAGKLMLYRGNGEVFSTARLNMGSGTSGKLVTEVKSNLRENAKGERIAVIDGSPGIGCPVIASLSGVNAVLIVAEPSISGISDMKRIVVTAKNFGVKVAILVNKYDLNLDKTREIEEYAREHNLVFAGKVPYDEMAVKAINSGRTIAEADTPSGRAVRDVFRVVMDTILA